MERAASRSRSPVASTLLKEGDVTPTSVLDCLLETSAAFPSLALPSVSSSFLSSLSSDALKGLHRCILDFNKEVSELGVKVSRLDDERAQKEKKIEGIETKIYRLEEQVAHMSAQSTAFGEKLRQLFRQSDAEKKEHIKTMAELRRKRERVENSIKLCKLEQERLSKFRKRSRVE